MYPEGFSHWYTDMCTQILVLKNKIYLYLHYHFALLAMFLPFKSK